MAKKLFLYISFDMHNVYRNLVANAPEGFEFVESEFMSRGRVQAVKRLSAGASIRRLASGFQTVLSPYFNHAHIRLNYPKVRKFHSDDYDLIHSGQSLLDNNLPYVVDFEHAAVFSGYDQYALRRPSFVGALERILLSSKIKKLLCWTDAAGKSLTNFVNNEEIARKMETFYPPVMAGRSARL